LGISIARLRALGPQSKVSSDIPACGESLLVANCQDEREGGDRTYSGNSSKYGGFWIPLARDFLNLMVIGFDLCCDIADQIKHRLEQIV
jgi:hypothetical protein